MPNARTKYGPAELDIELTDEPVCSYAHHNSAEPCWGGVVFRGIAPTCTGHSMVVSAGHYVSQERMKKAQTTGGSLRLSGQRDVTAMEVPEELAGLWDARNVTSVVPEASVDLFPGMVRPKVPQHPPAQHEIVWDDVTERVIVCHEEPLNSNVKIQVADDTEIPESWKDYL